MCLNMSVSVTSINAELSKGGIIMNYIYLNHSIVMLCNPTRLSYRRYKSGSRRQVKTILLTFSGCTCAFNLASAHCVFIPRNMERLWIYCLIFSRQTLHIIIVRPSFRLYILFYEKSCTYYSTMLYNMVCKSLPWLTWEEEIWGCCWIQNLILCYNWHIAVQCVSHNIKSDVHIGRFFNWNRLHVLCPDSKSHCGDPIIVTCLSSTMGFLILVRQHLHIESDP